MGFAPYVAEEADPELVREGIRLVGQLLEHPGSHYAAAIAGGSEHIGWGHELHLQADIRDLLLMILTGLGGEKLDPTALYPRPAREGTDDAAPSTIADFDVAGFMRRLAGR